jgi:Cu/Ag efflux protein CusF
MKHAIVVLVVGFVLLAFIGVAFAEEMFGQVTEMDTKKCTFTLEHHFKGKGMTTEYFNCETNSLIKDMKVGQHVTVEYNVSDGKNIVTKVTTMRRTGTGGWR